MRGWGDGTRQGRIWWGGGMGEGECRAVIAPFRLGDQSKKTRAQGPKNSADPPKQPPAITFNLHDAKKKHHRQNGNRSFASECPFRHICTYPTKQAKPSVIVCSCVCVCSPPPPSGTCGCDAPSIPPLGAMEARASGTDVPAARMVRPITLPPARPVPKVGGGRRSTSPTRALVRRRSVLRGAGSGDGRWRRDRVLMSPAIRWGDVRENRRQWGYLLHPQAAKLASTKGGGRVPMRPSRHSTEVQANFPGRANDGIPSANFP